MPKKDDFVYVGHIVDTARRALEKIKGKTKDDYDDDDNLQLALTHLIQIIGEAAGRLSEEFCRQHPDIPWDAVIGMRHKVVHDYMGVDEDIVWDTVVAELEPLIKKLEKILSDK